MSRLSVRAQPGASARRAAKDPGRCRRWGLMRARGRVRRPADSRQRPHDRPGPGHAEPRPSSPRDLRKTGAGHGRDSRGGPHDRPGRRSAINCQTPIDPVCALPDRPRRWSMRKAGPLAVPGPHDPHLRSDHCELHRCAAIVASVVRSERSPCAADPAKIASHWPDRTVGIRVHLVLP